MLKENNSCCIVCGSKANTQKVKVILKKEDSSEIEVDEVYIHIDCFYKLLLKAECR